MLRWPGLFITQTLDIGRRSEKPYLGKLLTWYKRPTNNDMRVFPRTQSSQITLQYRPLLTENFLFTLVSHFKIWAGMEKEMANHSSILAWRIPWTEEPGGLQSMGSKRVRYDWATSLSFSPLSWEDFQLLCFLEFSKTCDHIFFRFPIF